MVSLNMTRCSFILTTTLLFCVLVAVMGRSVENEQHLPEDFVVDTKIDEEDDDEARYMPSGGGSGPSSSAIQSILEQIMNLFQDQGSQEPNIIIIPLGGNYGTGNTGTGSGVGGGIGEAAQAAIIEAASQVVVNNNQDTTRRRRRRRRPMNGGNLRRIQNRRRIRPNGLQVFVLDSPDTQ